MTTPGLLKIKVFWNKGYDVIIYVHDVTNKTLFRDSNYIGDVVMWPKFGNSSIFLEKLSLSQFYKDLNRESACFEGWSWFKFNNLGVTLGMNLKFYTSVAKALKLKVKKFCGLAPTFVEVTGEKLVGLKPSDRYLKNGVSKSIAHVIMWSSMPIFSFIGYALTQLFRKPDNWRQIYKQTSLTFYTSNDVSKKNILACHNKLAK